MATKFSHFFSGKKEYQSLSNFWECEIRIGDRVYESGEHCFHGEKYTRLGELSEDRKQVLLDYGKTFLKGSSYTPSIAKQKGGKKGLRLTETELSQWNYLSIDVQREICKWKMNTYEEVRQDLRQSGTTLLIHPALRCSLEQVKSRIWEGRAMMIDGIVMVVGKNQLGLLWMECRSELK
jgi:predicted NAD-dependent protein-ADP-ribosyltransferase YbiA (DUF1768 family)